MSGSADLAITLSVRMGELEGKLADANKSLKELKKTSRETQDALNGLDSSTKSVSASLGTMATAFKGAVLASIGIATAQAVFVGLGHAIMGVVEAGDALNKNLVRVNQAAGSMTLGSEVLEQLRQTSLNVGMSMDEA